MQEPVIEIRPDGMANLYYKGRLWKRDNEDRYADPVSWYRVVLTPGGQRLEDVSPKNEKLLEEAYQDPSLHKKIQRFPRLGIPNKIAGFYEIPCTGQFDDVSSSWLVEGLISKGSLVLLTAPPSGYKTWFSLALAGAVSQGTNFLGYETIQTPVLYLNRENPLSVIRGRKDILGLKEGYGLKIWGNWLKDPPPPIGDPRLIEIARRHRPLMVFDSFVRFHSSDENSAKQMASVFGLLRRLADKGATVLLVHHQDKLKASQYRGSTDILAGVDVAFELHKEKTKNGLVLSLKCFKHRFIQEPKVTMRADFKRGRIEVVDDPSNADSSIMIERIKETIAREPGITQQELMDQAELPETKGRRLLQEGEETHWFSKRGEGKTLRYYPGKPLASGA